jgi:uracil phosphoribosyltransferase
MIKDSRFPALYIVNHPLILLKLSYMRDFTTSTRNFRDLLKEITLLMGYEIFRNLPKTTQQITTPICDMQAPVIAGRKVAVVPVLRAGLAMADGLIFVPVYIAALDSHLNEKAYIVPGLGDAGDRIFGTKH